MINIDTKIDEITNLYEIGEISDEQAKEKILELQEQELIEYE